METCLFCGSDKEAGIVRPDCDFICSSCTLVFMSISQERLQGAYELAVKFNKQRQMTAIEMFLEEVRYVGSSNEREISSDRGDVAGKRISGSSRDALVEREAVSVRG
jgi:hypothetical protein